MVGCEVGEVMVCGGVVTVRVWGEEGSLAWNGCGGGTEGVGI